MMHTMGVNIQCRGLQGKKLLNFLLKISFHLEINSSDKSVAICCYYPVFLSQKE
jgi:hypothetical protein